MGYLEAKTEGAANAELGASLWTCMANALRMKAAASERARTLYVTQRANVGLRSGRAPGYQSFPALRDGIVECSPLC